MNRGCWRNEVGTKQTLRVKLDGIVIQRCFRNKGEAINYLQRVLCVQKFEFAKRVQFIN